jgi:hypothetical protein
MLISGIVATALLVLIEHTERLSLFGQIELGINVYGIAVITVVVVIAVPAIALKPFPITLLMVTASYLLWNAAHGLSIEISRESIYSVIAELVLLSSALYIARKISQSIHRMETSIQNVVFQLDTMAVLSGASGEKAVTEELLRARQYEYGVTLIVVEMDELQRKWFSLWTTEKELKRTYLYAQAVRNLRSLIHETDVVYTHRKSLVACISELPHAEVLTLIGHLHDLFRVTHLEKVRIGTARFPDEGLVYQDLLVLACNRAAPTLDSVKNAASSDGPALTEKWV